MAKGGSKRHAERKPILELDFIGCVLKLAASIQIVFAFQEAGLADSSSVWRSALFLAPLLVGCLCYILLFGWETTVPRIWSIAPLLPMKLVRRRVYAAGVLCTITSGFVYFFVIYSLPLHFQVVYQKSVLAAGIALLPMLGSAAFGSMLGGILSGKKNRVLPVLITAAALMAIGSGLLSTVTSLTLQAKVYGFQVFIGLGFGLSISNITMLAILESSPTDHGMTHGFDESAQVVVLTIYVAVAQGIMAQARILGGSIGIAASTCILGVMERRELAGVPSSALASLQVSAHSLTAEQYRQVQQAYADSF